MGVFDGVLIASDWDGTLCMGKSIPDKNIEAVRYFQQNGGAFTVCSGRYYPYIEAFSDKIKPNTYLISLNGAYVIHPVSRHVLHEGVISDSVFSFIDDFSMIDGLFYGMTIYLSGCESGLSLTREEYLERRTDLLGKGVYKVIFVTDNFAEETADTIKKFDDQTYPIIITLPGRAGSNGSGLALLAKLSEKALGVDILNKEDK